MFMKEFYVDSKDALERLCESLRGSAWIALDTEFIREQTYYPRLCLLQLSNGEVAAAVDPIALPDLSVLLAILFDPDIVKVFHSGHQDLEIFQHRWQRLPTPLFDTQPAARLAGLGDQLGYANLVKLLLALDLPKGQARTDWSRRPLSALQLRYALDDVVYLGEVYLKLKQDLAGREDDAQLQQTLARLTNPATYSTPPESAWLRIRARRYLHGAELAVLQTLAGWRETEALRADKPRGWIVKDDVLVEMSRRQPQTIGQLQAVAGLTAKLVERRGALWLGLIADALDLPAKDWPTERRKPARTGRK
jgi:ribonuclease D